MTLTGRDEQTKKNQGAIQALAEAWASIDGKLFAFHQDRKAKDMGYGYYEGYLSDAAELEKRLNDCGYQIVPLRRRKEP